MKTGMLLGLAVGMVAGAAITCNSQKARQMMTGAQEQIKNKFNSGSGNCACAEQDAQSGGENGQN